MRTALVVLGNGVLHRDGVYRISGSCQRLVAEAERLAARVEPEVALFTGWSPAGGASEAEQMRDAWSGPPLELVVEPSARNTAQNAARTLPLLLERGVEHAIVVCAQLHLPRTRFFFDRLYDGTGIETSFHAARFVPSPRALAWELVALPVRRAQLRSARAEIRRRLA